MKSSAAASLILVILCQVVTADEPLQSQRFSIVQAGTRTILLDRVSGATWVLKESPSLQWQNIPRETAASRQSIPSVDRNVVTSGLELATEASKSAEAGESVTVAATVTNRSSTPCIGILMSFAPGLGEATSASHGVTLDGKMCVWKVERLDVGESKKFRVQIRFGKDAVGKLSKLTWTLRERSGAQTTRAVQIAVTEPEK